MMRLPVNAGRPPYVMDGQSLVDVVMHDVALEQHAVQFVTGASSGVPLDLPICNKLQNFLRSLQPILKNVIHSHKIHLPLPHTLHF